MNSSTSGTDHDRLAASESAGGTSREAGRIELAREAPFRLASLEVDPPRRRVALDDGREEIIEPRVMQVLVALARSNGRIVSRDELLESCWRGVIVGEDALNRVIGRVRRLSEGLGAGSFTIETITKVGYRLAATTSDQTRIGAITHPGARQPLALPDKPSIAVLPFKNLSGDAEQEYLADAVSEDVVTALSRWRWFFVIARHSSFTYKNRDLEPARIGEELGVRYLLTGGVRTSGQRVRVTVQLIDAATGSNLWADRFDRELVDVFALQDEVTQQVAAAIEPAMLQGEAVRIERKTLEDFSPLDCFYRGMWVFNQTSDDPAALKLFREAVRLDPELALGHVGISRSLYGRVLQRQSDAVDADLAGALASARTAIRLDPREATAHFAAAGAELYLAHHAAAFDEARLALNLNPNFAYGHYRLGQVLIFSGQATEAIAPIERALSLSPCDPQLWLMLETLALGHYQARQYEQAAEIARSAGRAGGGRLSAVLIAALARLGRLEEASQELKRAGAASSGQVGSRPLAAPYSDAALREHIREGFRLGREAFERGV